MSEKNSNKDPWELIEIIGGPVELGKWLGVKKSAPYSWKFVPVQQVTRLCDHPKIAKLGIMPWHVRPDVFAPPTSRQYKAALRERKTKENP